MKTERVCFVLYMLAAGAAIAAPAWDAKDGVIFPAEGADSLLHQCSRRSPTNVTGYWKPRRDQIASLETLLPALLEREIQRINAEDQKFAAKSGGKFEPRPLRMPKYVRQYAGIKHDGRDMVYVNGFDGEAVRGDWRNSVVKVCDGYVGFFGVEYDPQSKTFANFAFNGMA